MGNSNLISALKRANYISIEEKDVRFFDQRFHAIYIFQRHNFQMYRVRDSSQVRPGQPLTYYLRIINSLNDDDSIAIIEHMQTRLIHISHPNLVQYFAIAVEQETPHIKFVILEEDLGDDAITIKSLLDTIRMPQNKLLALYFGEKRYIYEFILQVLSALAYLNVNGKTFGELHGDISPMSIVIKLDTSSLQVKILDYLKIRDLVEIAQQQSLFGANEDIAPLSQSMLLSSTSSPRSAKHHTGPDAKSNKIQKALPYDAPERLFVNQKDIGIQADIWSLGAVLYEFLTTIDGSKMGQSSLNKLRSLSYEERVQEVRENVKDVAMQELLKLMLQDCEKRPTAEQLIDNPILRFFSYISRPNVSLDDTDLLSNQDPQSLAPALISALQLGDKNRAIVSFFTLMRILATMDNQALHDQVFSLVMRQQAYIQMVELLVICMKEYSQTQSSTLAPIQSDSFTDLYLQALNLLVKALGASELQLIVTGCSVTPAQMRRQFYHAGLLSLTLLLCEQIRRISRAVDPLPKSDATYVELSLSLLSQFIEQASPTALIAAEKTGLVKNLFKIFQSGKANEQTCQFIREYLQRSSCLLPVSVLQQMQIVLTSKRLDAVVLSNAPIFQLTKQIYKKFTLEALALTLVKLQTSSEPTDLLSYDTFERAVTRLVYFCSVQKTLKLANAFQLCTESLKLTECAREQGVEMRYDLAYTCQTCTNLLKGLTTEFEGSRTLVVCYSCAQLCHSKHEIEPAGFMSTNWTGCKCQIVQGFQVQQPSTTETAAVEQASETNFHKCKAKYETPLGDSPIKSELAHPQLILDQKFLLQERSRVQSSLLSAANQTSSIRKSDLITVLETDAATAANQSDFNNGNRNKKLDTGVVYTTESFDVVSICSSEPLCQISTPVMYHPGNSIPTVNSQIILSPELHQKQRQSYTMPTNQTPAGNTPQSSQKTKGDLIYGSGLLPSRGGKQLNYAGSVSKINLSSVALDSVSSLQQYNGSSVNGNSSSLLQQTNNSGQVPIEALVIRDQASSELSMLGSGDLAPGTDYIRAYFEVKVILGGFYDQLAIGLTSSADFPLQDQFVGYAQGSIGLHADDGKCFINGESMEYSSPYGSQSTIGCGITASGDIFFARDGLILPIIKSSAVWPDLLHDQPSEMMSQQPPTTVYPVISLRGKLTTVKINFGQCEDFILRTPQVNPTFDNPAVNIVMDNTMLKYLATELPKGHIQAIIESLKNYVARHRNITIDPVQTSLAGVAPQNSIIHSLIEDFFQRLQAFRSSTVETSRGASKNNRRGNQLGSLTNNHSSSQSNVRQATSNLQLYSSNSGYVKAANLGYQQQRQVPQTTKSGKSQMKFHYPQTLAQQQYTLSSQKRAKQKSTISPSSRLQQTSSLGQLSYNNVAGSKPDSQRPSQQPLLTTTKPFATKSSQQQLPHMSVLQRKRPSINSSQGGSLIRTDSRNQVKKSITVQASQKSLLTMGSRREKQHTTAQVSSKKLGPNNGYRNNRMISSIDHSKERITKPQQPQSHLKTSKSIASLANNAGVGVGGSGATQQRTSAATSKRGAMTSHQSNKNLAQSFSTSLMAPHGGFLQQSTASVAAKATAFGSQSVIGKRQNVPLSSSNGNVAGGVIGSGPAAHSKPVKNQQQLILVGSGQAGPTNLVTKDDGLCLTNQGSQESGIEKSSLEVAEQNYYSGGNPSFFQNASQDDHLGSLKNLRNAAGEQPSSSSSLIKGPKKSLKLSSKTGLNHNHSLSNLMAAKTVRSSHNYFSQQQKAAAAQENSNSSSIYHNIGNDSIGGGIPARQHSSLQDSNTPDGDGRASAAFTDQPLGQHMRITLDNQAAVLSQQDAANQRTGKHQAILASLTGQQQPSSSSSNLQASQQPKAFYKTYTDSAHEIPRNTHLLNRKVSSNRVQSSQVHQPEQNISTSFTNHGGPDLTGTKAHTIKASYIKVPKPRITSAMSAKAMTDGPGSQHHTSVRTSQHFNSKTSQQQKLQSFQQKQNPRQVQSTNTAAIKGGHQGTLQPSKSQKLFNFYPKREDGLNDDLSADLYQAPSSTNSAKQRQLSVNHNKQSSAVDQHPQVSDFGNPTAAGGSSNKDGPCAIF